MAVKRIKANIDVVTAARQRIKNAFKNGLKVYFSFSGGKDSLCMSDMIMKLASAGEIDMKLLEVIFVDEEAMYASCIAKVEEWRRKFIMAGATFSWYCIEVKHFSCYNMLTSDESYTCWDRNRQDAWIRKPPPYAIRNHPRLKPGIDNYQAFLPRITNDGIQLLGVRASESVQRLQYMAQLNLGAGKSITGKNMIYPIYDWRNADVWLYLRDNHIDIPDIYLKMYQGGVGKNQLRICQFFSVDCVGSLVSLASYEPGLWDRILKREPNAYLATLYWDSELYRRSSPSRRKNEAPKDYKALLKHMLFEDPGRYFTTALERKVADAYKKLLLKSDGVARDRDYRKMYDALVAGDPKLRTMRAVTMDIFSNYAEHAKKFRKQGGGERSV